MTTPLTPLRTQIESNEGFLLDITPSNELLTDALNQAIAHITALEAEVEKLKKHTHGSEYVYYKYDGQIKAVKITEPTNG